MGYANARYSTLTAVGGVPGLGTTGLYSSGRWGWAAGAGVEYGFSPNWSAKLEYLHYGLDSVTAPAGTLSINPISATLRVDTIKIGVNYRWGERPMGPYRQVDMTKEEKPRRWSGLFSNAWISELSLR